MSGIKAEDLASKPKQKFGEYIRKMTESQL